MRSQRQLEPVRSLLRRWPDAYGKYDARSNVYPRKSRPEQKIDAAVTTIMGIGRALTSQPARSRYEDPNEKVLFV